MSLICWVPLTSNTLNNQGIENMSVTNNGATYSSSGGKLGAGCWSFSDGTKNGHGISINKNFTDIGSDRSICAWVYPKGNHADYAGAIVSSGNWNSSRWSFGVERANGGFTGFDSGYSSYYSTSIPLNTWTHLCVTVSDGVTKFYKNGIYLGEQSRGSGTINSDASNTMIGRETYANGYFGFNGSIQDVRIYDHCLSAQEVKEISKGLVLHYPLNELQINRDLLNGSYQNIRNSNNEFINLFDMTSIIDANGTGKLYTVSFDAKADINHSFNIYGSYGTSPKYSYTSSSIEVTTEWKHFSKTFTPRLANESSTWSGVSLYGIYGSGAIIHVRNVKFELGNAETPFILENQQIHDCSGYNNNGTVTGTLTTSTDTPRYDKCTLGTSSTITTPYNISDGPMTLAFWLKPVTYTTEDTSRINIRFGNCLYFTYNNYTYFNHNGDYKYRYVNPFLDGNWHFIVCLFDGANTKIFIDGSEITCQSSSNPRTFVNSLTMTLTGENVSDFRIYTTALSADDVKALYQEAAFIDHKGNIGCYLFYEDGENSKELLPIPTSGVAFNNDGSYLVNGHIYPPTDYIPINPSGKTYYYDIEYSNLNSGNHLYIGFEKYDINKASGSNSECLYLVNTTSVTNHTRVTGTINLATANGTTAAFTKLRVLNNWDNAAGTNQAIIHHISLKEISTLTLNQINKQGQIKSDLFIEADSATVSKYGNITANQLIEI